ncbi:hypothetical protein [Motilimonas eburnea]|uniref:hypothetical protein n=1 Tax=Motilimonas eburnea TaxID=1737488 RepID=UPI001E4C0483|nr:hypothetical protein [Motilimonas eburnea]MCE2571128.1 hypothetical protein [Motilimonas eburnea]
MQLSRFEVITKSLLLVLLTLSALVLSACGSSGLKEDVKKITRSKADISFVNTTYEVVAFYAKHDDPLDSKDQEYVFNSQNRRFSQVDIGDMATYEYTFQPQKKQLHLGVQDSNSQTRQGVGHVDLDYKVKQSKPVWAVAWLQGEAYKITAFAKRVDNQDAVYRVRIFSHHNLPVYLNGADTVSFNLEQGKVSAMVSVNNCATGLKVGEHSLDLCQASLGKSYLMVVNNTGLLSLQPEA